MPNLLENAYWKEPYGGPYSQGMHPQTLTIQEEMRRLQDRYMAKMCDDFLTGPRTASENNPKPIQSQNLILLLCN